MTGGPRFKSILAGSVVAVLLIGAEALLLSALMADQQFESVRVQVIDRGNADGILIRTPNSRWVVIDAGTNREQAVAMRDIWGVDTVALAVVSHRHLDHLGGMDEILEEFPVQRLIMNPADCPGNVSDDSVRSHAQRAGVAIQPAGADTIEIDEVRFIILPTDPVADVCPLRENDNSILVRMEFGDFSMLFTGDAETDEREWLMEHHPTLLAATVLKAAHHGSHNGADGTFNGRTWIQVVDPLDIIISAHRNSQHGHPHAEAMDVYEGHGEARIFCTSRMGTIRVYGFRDGHRTVRKQFPFSGSCRFGAA